GDVAAMHAVLGSDAHDLAHLQLAGGDRGAFDALVVGSGAAAAVPPGLDVAEAAHPPWPAGTAPSAPARVAAPARREAERVANGPGGAEGGAAQPPGYHGYLRMLRERQPP